MNILDTTFTNVRKQKELNKKLDEVLGNLWSRDEKNAMVSLLLMKDSSDSARYMTRSRRKNAHYK
jgi:hypothetical protein